jgi:hypothetical protein
LARALETHPSLRAVARGAISPTVALARAWLLVDDARR